MTIVEIMGRHAGRLTASSILARQYKGDNPVLIYTPESPFSQEAFSSGVYSVQAALRGEIGRMAGLFWFP